MRRRGIDALVGLFRLRVLNFHTTAQVVAHVKHATVAVKLDDDISFRADGLHRALDVSDGKAFPAPQFPQFVGDAIVEPDFPCAVNFDKGGHNGMLGRVDRFVVSRSRRGYRRDVSGEKIAQRDRCGSPIILPA